LFSDLSPHIESQTLVPDSRHLALSVLAGCQTPFSEVIPDVARSISNSVSTGNNNPGAPEQQPLVSRAIRRQQASFLNPKFFGTR
jgi:hypothetical protein